MYIYRISVYVGYLCGHVRKKSKSDWVYVFRHFIKLFHREENKEKTVSVVILAINIQLQTTEHSSTCIDSTRNRRVENEKGDIKKDTPTKHKEKEERKKERKTLSVSIPFLSLCLFFFLSFFLSPCVHFCMYVCLSVCLCPKALFRMD